MVEADPIVRLNSALSGRYHVERKLGEGGMATVYLARDQRHERTVALKVLKPEVGAAIGAQRFLAEIKTTANLQHPHILPLHDSGEVDGLLFYVMPYVEGESLRERLDREQQLPVDDAVRIATDLAEALDYAHRQGVVHRDIKPANVLLLDDKPVISDFGIALAVSSGGGDRLTETGLSLGTPHYMSPEQATGDQRVGPAADIWALGCVLHEMLVGEPPFTGSTPQAVLGRILTSEPRRVSEERATPPHVGAVVRRALARVPADRFGSAGAFANALVDPSFRWGEGREGASEEVARLRRVVRVALAVALLMASALLWQWMSGLDTDAPLEPTYASIPMPDGRSLAGGSSQSFALSANGEIIAFRTVGPDGESEVWVRRLAEPEAVLVAGAEGAGSLFLSPDGEWLGFHHVPDRTIRRIRVSGGSAEVVGSTGAAPRESFTGAAWGPDGRIVVGLGGGRLRVFPQPGAAPIDLDEALPMSPDSVYRYSEPRLLPDGEGIIVRRRVAQAASTLWESAVVVVDFEGNVWPLVSGGDPTVTEDGVLVYSDGDSELWAVQLEADYRGLAGEPVRVAEGVSEGYWLADDGTMVYPPVADASDPGLAWVDRSGTITPILYATDSQLPPGVTLRVGLSAARVSPDGSRVAFRAFYSGSRPQFRVFIYDLVRRVVTPLSVAVSADFPVWTPDGRSLLVNHFMDDNSVADVYVARADNAVPPRPFWPPTELLMQHAQDFTPDGRHLIYQERSSLSPRSSDSDIWVYSLETQRSEVLVDRDGEEKQAAVSPDGRWLAFTSDVSGQDEVYVTDFPGASVWHKISNGTAFSPVWSPIGDELFYMRADRTIMAVDVTLGGSITASTPEPLIAGQFHAGYPHGRAFDISPDGERFLVGDLSADVARLDLVRDWITEVRRRLGS